jgi:peptidoglycan/xylan/chitin deacetylase (PgdA/CDA1 family)
MSDIDWSPLVSALDGWHAQGRVARFWLRDDDAVEPTPALLRLLELGGRHGIPLALAVIPAGAGQALARLLADRTDVDVALHGWSHANHAPAGQKKQELGSHRPADVVLAELAEGHGRLLRLFDERYVPVLVPPWNRIDASLLPSLEALGIEALSVFGAEKAGPPAMINTHADIMDWHGTYGCRPASAIMGDVVARLVTMAATGGTMGLLTHHLVHDEAAWAFIDGMVEATVRHPACRWCALRELI